MTRKDFELVAHGLRVGHQLACTDTASERYQRHFAWLITVGSVADQLAMTNPRFDRDRFITACKSENCAECAR